MAIQVSAILLAAGLSRRMGRPKPLLALHGKPFIRHCLEAIVASGVRDIVVVLGANWRKVAGVIDRLPTKIVLNKDPASEMAKSVQLGLHAADRTSSRILICLSDHPMVVPETFQKIINAHFKDPTKILIPTYDSRRGHPSLFPRSLIEEVFTGANLRKVIRTNQEAVTHLPVDDIGTILDIDSMDDYKKVSSYLRENEAYDLKG